MYSSLSQHAYSRLTFLLLQNDPKWKTDYVTERIDMGLSSASPLEDSGKVILKYVMGDLKSSAPVPVVILELRSNAHTSVQILEFNIHDTRDN